MKHGNARTRVLLHVVASPRSTVRSAADAAGIGVTQAHRHLTILRDEGLVEWDEGRHGTLRANVRPVPFGDGPEAA